MTSKKHRCGKENILGHDLHADDSHRCKPERRHQCIAIPQPFSPRSLEQLNAPNHNRHYIHSRRIRRRHTLCRRCSHMSSRASHNKRGAYAEQMEAPLLSPLRSIITSEVPGQTPFSLQISSEARSAGKSSPFRDGQGKCFFFLGWDEEEDRPTDRRPRPGIPLSLSPFRHLILINLMCYANRASAIRHAHSSLSRGPGSGRADTPLPFGRSPGADGRDDDDNGIERRRRPIDGGAQKQCSGERPRPRP